MLKRFLLAALLALLPSLASAQSSSLGSPQPLSCAMVANACGTQAFTRSALGASAFFKGTAAPTTSVPAGAYIGDYYIRLPAGQLYQNVAGTWSLIGSFTNLAETPVTAAIVSNTLTLDLSLGTTFNVASNANINTLSIVNPPSGLAVSFTLVLTGNGTAYTQGGFSSVRWPGGIAPIVTTTSGKIDIYACFEPDGLPTWLCTIVGQSF